MGDQPRKLRLEEMTWREVADAIRAGYDTALLAVGSTEQHGPHLPLSVDSLIGEAVADRVALGLGNTLVAPTIRVGVSSHHMSFPGTITISEELLVDTIAQYCGSLAAHGFRRIAVFPSHSGNCSAVRRAITRASDELPRVEVVGFWDMMEYFRPWFLVGSKAGLSEEVIGPHAGEAETSIVLALRPDLVQMAHAEAGYVGNIEAAREKIFRQGLSVQAIVASGVLGDPSRADAARGSEYLDATVNLLVMHFRSQFDSGSTEIISR
jgi:creatinine amidohydrolase